MANFDRIYDSLHKSEKRKAELEAKIKPLEEKITRLEHEGDRLRDELEQTNRERLALSKEIASVAQTKEALHQENTTLREAMQHMQQAVKAANQDKAASQAAFLEEKQHMIETLEQANDRYAAYRGLLEARASSPERTSSGSPPQADAESDALRTQLAQLAEERDNAQQLVASLQEGIQSLSAEKSNVERYCHELEERFQQSQESFGAWADAVRQFIKLCGIPDEEFENHFAAEGFAAPEGNPQCCEMEAANADANADAELDHPAP